MDYIWEIFLFTGVMVFSLLASLNGTLSIFLISLYTVIKTFAPTHDFDWSYHFFIILILSMFMALRIKHLLINIIPIVFTNAVIICGVLWGRIYQPQTPTYAIKLVIGVILLLLAEMLRRFVFNKVFDENPVTKTGLKLSVEELFFIFILSFSAGIFGMDLFLILYIYLLSKKDVGTDEIDIIFLSGIFSISLFYLMHKLIIYESSFSDFVSIRLLFAVLIGCFLGFKIYKIIPLKMKTRLALVMIYILSIKNIIWGIIRV